MRDAIIIQIAYSGSKYAELIALAYPRHVRYALQHRFDYLAYVGSIMQIEEPHLGGWEKLFLIQQALEHGYDFVAYIDADALIADLSADWRDALRGRPFSIGACQHPKRGGHLNAGVLFFRRAEATMRFVRDWLSNRASETDRWQEQATLNRMASNPKYAGIVGIIPGTYNATRAARTYDPDAIIVGFHAPESPEVRLAHMKAEMARLDHSGAVTK